MIERLITDDFMVALLKMPRSRTLDTHELMELRPYPVSQDLPKS
jgi:hypothetical protein